MKNVKRIICILLTLMMLVAVFSACGEETSAKVTVSSELDSEGRFIWAVVRPSETSSEIDDASKSIRTSLKSAFGAKVTILKDLANETTDDSYEILIGDTNRKESAEAKEILAANRTQNGRDFIVKVTGKKIAIIGMNDTMSAIGANWFENTFCQTPETWTLLYDGYQYIYNPEMDDTACKVNGADLGQFTVVRPRFMRYIYGMYVEEYLKYMGNRGFTVTEVDEREAEKDFEILVGDTTRAASKSVNVEGDNFVIKVVGNKLVIKGGSDLATYRAMLQFLETVKEAYTSGKGFDWSDGYTENGKYDPEEPGAYTCNFFDEFEGSSLDLNKWGDYGYGDKDPSKNIGDSCLGGKVYNIGIDNTTSKYVDDTGNPIKNSWKHYVADGCWNVKACRINETDFMSTEIGTYYTMVYRYGLCEVNVKFAEPPATSSIWMNGAIPTYREKMVTRLGGIFKSGMTEIDLVENFGRMNFLAANVHRWCNVMNADGTNASSGGHTSLDADPAFNTGTNQKNMTYDAEKNGDNIYDNFHVVSFYWDDTCYKFALDGKVWCDYQFSKTTDSVTVHCSPLYLLIGLGIGSASYGTKYNPETDKEQYLQSFDSVYIYQTDDINSQMVYGWSQYEDKGTTRYRYPDVNMLAY